MAIARRVPPNLLFYWWRPENNMALLGLFPVSEVDAGHNDEIWSLAVHIFPGSYVKFYVQLRCSILFLL
jgi:hypothetical protein